jgi:hypothetical protein
MRMRRSESFVSLPQRLPSSSHSRVCGRSEVRLPVGCREVQATLRAAHAGPWAVEDLSVASAWFNDVGSGDNGDEEKEKKEDGEFQAVARSNRAKDSPDIKGKHTM